MPLLLSLALLTAAALIRPQRAACPLGHDLRTGIRRDGSFECWPHPVGDPDWDGTWGRPERGTQPAGVLAARIYCGGGAVPTVLDYRTVACR